MTQAIIGALRVSLGLDSAQFQSGARNAVGTLERMRTSLVQVSAAMAAVGVAAFALVNNVSQAGVEIARQSALANTSATDFQRMAAAAATVGIEQDKLAGILKDVNDRVGEFLSTGGGPMADFFENIAPKVGVTADQFRDLSGADALQLFVSSLEAANLSQAEMTFYMEAMAGDATALIPLLRQNGAEITRLGDAAQNAGAIMSEEAVANSVEFREALGRLSQSALGLRNTIAEELMPIFTKMIDRIATDLVPIIQKVIATVAGWVDAFQGLPGPVQEAVGVIALALGTGGPIIAAIAVLRVAILGLIGMTGPIGLFIAAAATLYAAWQKWGDNIKAAVGPAIDFLGEKFDGLLGKITTLVTKAGEAARAIVKLFTLGDEVDAATPYGPGATAPAADAFGVGSNIGQSVAGGLVSGLNDADVDQATRDWINGVRGAAEDELEIRSPSRVFARIGRFISEGLGLGIMEGAGSVTSAMNEVVGATVDPLQQATAQLSSFGQAAKSSFTAFVTGAQSASQAGGNLLRALAGNFADTAFDYLFAPFFGGLPGFANGTMSAPGGLSWVGERGPELVNLPRGSQVFDAQTSARMMDGGGPASTTMNFNINLAGANGDAAIEAAVMRGVQQAVSDVGQKIASDPYFGKAG
jgi:hypothetical protein